MLLKKSTRLPIVICLSIAGCFLFSSVSSAQQSGTDQTVFNDEGEMLQMDNAQTQQLEREEMSAEAKANQDDEQDRTYRLYAEKRVEELEKVKGRSAEQQIAVLQKWLSADAEMRAQDRQTIRGLRQQIAGLQKSQQQVMANLGNDVNAMRQDSQNQEDNVKFNQMMQINHFNELQTEMGPANWETPSSRGAYYSMHGMGFSGGRGLW